MPVSIGVTINPVPPGVSSKTGIKLRWRSTNKQAAREMEAFCPGILQRRRVFQITDESSTSELEQANFM